jgi:hypothetical protein
MDFKRGGVLTRRNNPEAALQTHFPLRLRDPVAPALALLPVLPQGRAGARQTVTLDMHRSDVILVGGGYVPHRLFGQVVQVDLQLLALRSVLHQVVLPQNLLDELERVLLPQVPQHERHLQLRPEIRHRQGRHRHRRQHRRRRRTAHYARRDDRECGGRRLDLDFWGRHGQFFLGFLLEEQENVFSPAVEVAAGESVDSDILEAEDEVLDELGVGALVLALGCAVIEVGHVDAAGRVPASAEKVLDVSETAAG